MKRYCVWFFVTCIIIFSMVHFPTRVWGVACERKDSASETELQQIIEACQQQVSQLSQQRDTLTKQILYMDSQIYLSELNIRENQNLIINMKKEIESLGERIGELNSTMTQVSEITTEKIRTMYKRQRRNPMLTALVSKDITTLLRSVQYLKRTQENDRNTLLHLQDTKVNFNEQKTIREQKEEELNKLNVQLENYKVSLANQQQEKENILSQTKNDEKTYQQLLSQAKAQISAFTNFVSNSGASGTIGANALGTGDGSYYSQRDERWAFHNIGNSSTSIVSAGCLVTSVAMVLKSKGVDVTPADIANNPCNFDLCSTADMSFNISLPGGYQRASSPQGNVPIYEIDNKLNDGNSVIVGLNTYGDIYPNHFIVLKKVDGDDYIIYDPIWGPNIKFSEHYSRGQIFSAEIIL